MPRSHPTQGSCFVWGDHTSPRWDTGLQERQEMLHIPWGPHLLRLLMLMLRKHFTFSCAGC